MRLLNLLFLSSLATAAPGSTLHARAAVNDPCNIGYCTQNGGTTGGGNAAQVTVKSLSELAAAASATGPSVILVQGSISGAAKVQVASDKTIIGKSGSSLTGIGFTINGKKNVIIRNMKIAKVAATYGDAITIQKSTNVWVDHCDISSEKGSDKDFYDGLVDLSHAADFVTISHSYLHDHHKGSLVGHSDSNAAEDVGKLRVTYANNHFKNIGSRGPLLRFGTAHIFNGYYDTMDTGLNSRMNAQALIQSSVFTNVGKKAIFSESSKEVGYVVAEDVVLNGQSQNTAPKGNLSSGKIPYQFNLLGSGKVASTVPGQAGQKLSF
ncbi:Pectate lyase plyB [Fusarium venenatum]|uniref:pectin lyase fold/virulence factor n=1 Tax=Fusarium venenatum TaxID=56646 RepID=UPI001DE80BEE|nr:Pectate lyase plyB [Fusarium venenatum]KAH6967171.1 pectin lyase fold/virulence factor [Fusarium venenatum]